jgi:glycerol-1-phosphate dehydrogenase [NAD(P)+]
VGSGTSADIGKVLAASHHVPYVVVQTAGSVNGFADDRSVLLVSGVKRTVQSTWADALIADSDVIARAPVEMNVSGLGDLIAMFTAPADWYLATILGMDDSYSPSVVALTRDQGPTLLGTAHLLPRADRTAIGQLVATLTASGISMGVAGTTAPSSGMEHAVGHLIDMASVQANEDTVLHGSQVGATSIVAALLWQRVLGELSSGGLKRLKVPDALEAEADLRAAFSGVDPTGEMGEECWRDYERKLALWAKAGEHIEHAADNWATHEETLRHLLAGPGELVAALRSARAAVGFGELTPPVSPDDVRWAVTNCRFLRNRLSIADAAVFLGIWDDAYIDALLEDAAALAGVA